MPLAINWNQIRALNGSQAEGFEELVCQLARSESVPVGSTFQRKGKPDGGVECYWKFPNDSEWGWQAKFFNSSPSNAQWGELDESVKQFLKTHPQLIKLTVALPLDLPDARMSNQKSARKKWEEHIAKWHTWANGSGHSVEFEYWGAHEIVNRLSQAQHRGRVFFWFEKEFFNSRWFTERIEECIVDAGARYTPELDVSLPIAQVFDGLGRTEAFYKRLKGFVQQLRKNLPTTARVNEQFPALNEALIGLREQVKNLCDELNAIDEHSIAPIDWQNVERLIQQSQQSRQRCAEIIDETRKMRDEIQTEESFDQQGMKPSDLLNYIDNDLYRVRRSLDNIWQFIKSDEALLANAGVMLLVGEAGKGKTHLFCDIARKRNTAELPTIFLLGEKFKDDVWQQLLELLDLGGQRREDFLGALAAAAQLRGRKAMILIDALNETDDPLTWRKHLASFLQIIKRYEWISVALSVRSSYEDMVVPEDIDETQFVRVEHRGFEGVEYEATRHFFDHYGIEQPSVPLLNPEFETPLFLKILCIGLKKAGVTRIPKGLHGVSAIFDFFISEIEKRLRLPNKLNLSPNSNVVHHVIDQITEVMAERTVLWIPVVEAEQIINGNMSPRGYTDSLFYHLLSEGLLSKDRYGTDSNELVEGVSFAYQRLADHLIAKHLLDRYLGDKPELAFTTETPLRALTGNHYDWWTSQSRGLIEALSIQLPERIGRELLTIVPDGHWYIERAFVESVLWRSHNAFSQETLDCVIRVVQASDLRGRFLDVLLTVAVDPVHPYNADFLHRRLMKDEMSVRDAWWSIYIFEQYTQKNAVDRLVAWAWANNDKSRVEEDSIRLCGVALSWFLTTSHRFLRDRATKALVNLLTLRLDTLGKIIEQFSGVNDMYVLERLMAVAYGCAMRSANDEQIARLGQQIYDLVFADSKPLVHILFRDYARGVIEYALSRGLAIDGDMEKILPPYNSDWVKIPAKEEIDALEVPVESYETSGSVWGQNWIIHSVMDWDFATYVIGTNDGHADWLSLRLSDPLWSSWEDERDAFVSSLDSSQLTAWEAFDNARRILDSKSFRIHIDLSDEELQEILSEANLTDGQIEVEEARGLVQDLEQDEITRLQQDVALAEGHFLKSLDGGKRKAYDTRLRPILENGAQREDAPYFDISQAQRWIVKRVFDLGWTQERFGPFDKYVSRDMGRAAQKPERIGKKYQWLAYHEILARLADNFQFRETYSSHADRRQYKGTWQLHVRDIDPSCVLKSTPRGDDGRAPSWWHYNLYSEWGKDQDHVEWMKSVTDLPKVAELIETVNPCDQSRWFASTGFYKWEEPTPFDQDRYEVSRREIWYKLQGYLVRIADIEEVYEWAIQQDFMGNWLPEGRNFYHLYLGELYWSPSYKYHEDPYLGRAGWSMPTSQNNRSQCPKPILPLTESYHVEGSGFDCSIDEGYSIQVPVKQLANEMRLHWFGIEGHYFDEARRIIAFDPSVKEVGPSALLIHRDTFLEYLANNQYAVIWTVLGEKRLIGGGHDPDDWKGDTTINGVYRVVGNKIEGNLSTNFRNRTQ